MGKQLLARPILTENRKIVTASPDGLTVEFSIYYAMPLVGYAGLLWFRVRIIYLQLKSHYTL